MSVYDDIHGMGGGGHGPAAPEMPSELRQQLHEMQDMQEMVAGKMSGGIALPELVQRNADGKSYIFGMFEVTPELKPILPYLNYAYTSGIGPLSSQLGEYVYRHANTALVSNAIKRIGVNLTPATAEKIAGKIGGGVGWTLVFSEPIASTFMSGRRFFKDRQDLSDEFRPIIGTYHISNKNTVMNAAFSRANSGWMHDLKMTAGGLVAYIPAIRFGMQEQKRLKAERIANPATSAHGAAPTDPHQLRQDAIAQVNQECEDYLKTGAHPDDAADYRRTSIQNILRGNFTSGTPATPAAATPGDGSIDGMVSKLFGGIPAIAVWGMAANVASNYVKGLFGGKSDPRTTGKPIAWELIKNLKEELGGTQELLNENAPGFGELRERLQQYVTAIFQQAETDAHRPSLKRGALDNLQPAVNLIVDKLAHGTLDVYALVKLVGEDKVIAHNGTARSFVKLDKLQDTLSSMAIAGNAAKSITKEEFFANFMDPALIEQTLKHDLATLKGPARAFIVSLCPDNILLRAGMKKADIDKDRVVGRDFIHATMGSCVQEMAELSNKELEARGLGRDEIAIIRNLAERIAQGDLKALEVAVDGRDQTVVDAVRTSLLSEQLAVKKEGGDGQEVWTKKITKSSAVRKEIDQAAKDAANPDAKSEERQYAADIAPRDQQYSAAERNRHEQTTIPRGVT